MVCPGRATMPNFGSDYEETIPIVRVSHGDASEGAFHND